MASVYFAPNTQRDLTDAWTSTFKIRRCGRVRFIYVRWRNENEPGLKVTRSRGAITMIAKDVAGTAPRQGGTAAAAGGCCGQYI